MGVVGGFLPALTILNKPSPHTELQSTLDSSIPIPHSAAPGRLQSRGCSLAVAPLALLLQTVLDPVFEIDSKSSCHPDSKLGSGLLVICIMK